MFLKDNYSKIKFHDQDILNALLYDERLTLPPCWNNIMYDGKANAIIHFAGIKPWEIECTHPLKELFWKYLSETRWKDMKPIYHYSFMERIKRRIKKAIGMK